MSGHDHNHHHGHSHGGGGGGHSHSCADEHDPADRGVDETLYKYIDLDNCRSFNCKTGMGAKEVIKPWSERDDNSKFLESDCDESFILHIPFTGLVKLKSIGLRTALDGQAPRTLRLFKDRDDIDFSNVEDMDPVQVLDVQESGDVLFYQPRIAKFANISSLTIHVPENAGGGDVTQLFYLGLKGDFERSSRQVVHAVYEARPQAADHPLTQGVTDGGRMGF